MTHLRYLRYLLRHKWYVFVECCRAGMPWRGLIHDWHKFLPDEWLAYAEHFYALQRANDESGYIKADDQGDRGYDAAWLRHIHRGPHHWNHWIMFDGGEVKVLEMPPRYRREMLCDWRGAGRAQGFGDNTPEWYTRNKDKMLLGPKTRAWVELEIGQR